MTYNEIVTALTDAIDRQNPTPPPGVIDGSAGEGDEIPAEKLLARLTAAKSRLDAAAAGAAGERARQLAVDAEYSQRLASYNEWRAARFPELDRATRTLEELVLAAALANPAYLNQTPPPTFRAPGLNNMDPGTPGDVNDIDAAITRANVAISFGPPLRISSSIVDGVRFSVRGIDQQPPRRADRDVLVGRTLLNSANARVGSAQITYAAAESEAVLFLNYLAGP